MEQDDLKPCGKILHTSEDSADVQGASLGEVYGRNPNTYLCIACSVYYQAKIWHVGYGYDGEKLAKKSRRRRKQKRRKHK